MNTLGLSLEKRKRFSSGFAILLGFKTVQIQKLYIEVYLPIVTYAPSTWPTRLSDYDHRMFRKVQRNVLVSVSGSYIDTSYETLYVISENLRYVAKSKKADTLTGQKTITQKLIDEAVEEWQIEWAEKKRRTEREEEEKPGSLETSFQTCKGQDKTKFSCKH